MENAFQRIKGARKALVLDHPFWGMLSLKLEIVADREDVDTMATDGSHLYYNTKYVKSQSEDILLTLWAHEVMHCAMHHHTRRGDREPDMWNSACDYAINPILTDAGFTLWEGALLRGDFKGKSAEQIYAVLKQEKQQQQQQDKQEEQPQDPDGSEDAGAGGGDDDSDEDGDQSQDDDGDQSGDGQGDSDGDGDGDGQGDTDDSQGKSGSKDGKGKGGQPGQVLDAAEPSQNEAEWTVAVKQAEKAAEMMGNLPGHMKMLVEQMTRPRVDWRSLLRRWVQEKCAADYSWKQPNRRYAPQGIYLPSVRSEEMGKMVVFVDSSYSTSFVVPAFKAELQAVKDEMQPSELIVVMCDAAVQRVDRFARDEAVEFHLQGLGGTDFRPAFEWVEAEGEEPVCAVFLTDGYPNNGWPDPADYPVLWAICSDIVAPWGETVKIEVE